MQHKDSSLRQLQEGELLKVDLNGKHGFGKLERDNLSENLGGGTLPGLLSYNNGFSSRFNASCVYKYVVIFCLHFDTFFEFSALCLEAINSLCRFSGD